MCDSLDQSAIHHLRVGEHVREVIDGTRRNADPSQIRGPLGACARAQFCIDDLLERLPVLFLIAGFGWAFYLHAGLVPFMVLSFFIGLGGGNAATYALWLPEQYPTSIRATAFAFSTSTGRFFAVGVSLCLGVAVSHFGTLGTPIAMTACIFVVGIIALRWAVEKRGAPLRD